MSLLRQFFHKFDNSKEYPTSRKLKKDASNFESQGKDEIIWEQYKLDNLEKEYLAALKGEQDDTIIS